MKTQTTARVLLIKIQTMENIDSLYQSVTTSITAIEKKIILLISVPVMLVILHMIYPMLLGIFVADKQISDQEMRNYLFHISLVIQLIGVFSTLFIFRQLVKSKKYRTIGTVILFLHPTITIGFAIINYFAKIY